MDWASFLEESSDYTEMWKYVVDDETDIKTIELPLEVEISYTSKQGFIIIAKTKKEEKIY